MLNIIPEIFLGLSLLFLLVCGSILSYSFKYNYPILCFQSYTYLILLWLIILIFNTQVSILNNYFIFDNISLCTKLILCFALILCLFLSKTKKIKAFEYYILILIVLLGLLLISSSQDLIGVYLCLELQSLSFYILACFQRKSAFSAESALKYFLLGAISSSLLLLGISFVYGFCGSTNIQDLQNLGSINFLPLISQLGLILFSVGLLFKIGCVPFHLWLADVYEGAPTFVTSLFAVLPKLSIFVVFFRLVNTSLPNLWINLFIGLALLSLVYGSLLALMQYKTKRLLAFSGISHVGYSLVGLSCSSFYGFQASILYIFIYIITSVFLWSLCLCVSSVKGRSLYLSDFLGWGKTNLFLSLIASLVCLSLAGIPPLGGFFAKFNIFSSSFDFGFYLASLLGLLTSAIGILYYLRILKLMHFEDLAWNTPIFIEKTHALAIGLSSFFLIFFVLFGSFINTLTQLISICI